MVYAADIEVGEYIRFKDKVVCVKETGEESAATHDGKAKIKLTFADEKGEIGSYISLAEEDFDLLDAPGTVSSTGTRRRAGVSSETGFDPTAMSNWKKVIVPKTDEERKNLIMRVQSNVFFEHMDEIEQNELADVVFEQSFKAGAVLMEEGDEGDLFYIIDDGEADIYVLNEHGEEVMVRECKQGDSFGELALMYNAPRNATIKARSELRCWCMDRENFRYVIMGGSHKKRQRYLGFLDSVKILDGMGASEKMKLVDALIPRKVDKGTVIVKQGDAADMFYILERGAVEVTQLTPEGKTEVVNTKTTGDFFGEIALMSDIPRSATITATEDNVLLTLDRKTFVALLGPQEALFRTNVTEYKTYVDYSGI